MYIFEIILMCVIIALLLNTAGNLFYYYYVRKKTRRAGLIENLTKEEITRALTVGNRVNALINFILIPLSIIVIIFFRDPLTEVFNTVTLIILTMTASLIRYHEA